MSVLNKILKETAEAAVKSGTDDAAKLAAKEARAAKKLAREESEVASDMAKMMDEPVDDINILKAEKDMAEAEAKAAAQLRAQKKAELQAKKEQLKQAKEKFEAQKQARIQQIDAEKKAAQDALKARNQELKSARQTELDQMRAANTNPNADMSFLPGLDTKLSKEDIMRFVAENKSKAALGGLGVGAAGLGISSAMSPKDQMLADKINNPPPAPPTPAVAPEQPEEAPVDKTIPARKAPAVASQPTAEEKELEKLLNQPSEAAPQQEQAASKTMNTIEGLQKAIDRRESEALLGGLGKALAVGSAGALGLASGSDTKPITELAEDTIKRSGRHLEDFEKLGEKEKNDPSSPISKQFRDFMKPFGITVPEDMSAEAAAKLMPYAYQKFAASEAQKSREMIAKENREARKEAAAERAAARATEADKKADAKAFDQATKLKTNVQKQTKELVDTYDARSQLVEFLDDAIKNPTGKGFQDVAIDYGFIKGRDNTAVREGELKLLTQAGSIGDRARRELGKALRGEKYNEDDLRALQAVLRKELNQLSKTYQKRVDQNIKFGEKYNIQKDDIVDRPDIYQGKPEVQAPQSDTVIVQEKATGRRKKLPRAQAEQVLKDARYEEVK